MDNATQSPAAPGPIHIVELRAENVKKLKAIEIHPRADGVTLITGANGQGKTSVLDSLFFALAGKDAQKETPKPIRAGETKAEVNIVTSDGYRIRRWWSVTNSYLELTAPDGMPMKSPQELLDSWTGVLTFDPLAFSRMKPADQRAALLQIVNIDIDLEANERRESDHRERRKIINRDVDSLQAQFDAIPFAEIAAVPDEEINVTDLTVQLEDAQAHNNAYANEKRMVEADEQEVKKLETEIADLAKALKEKTDLALQKTQALTAKKDAFGKMSGILTQPIVDKIKTAEETNRKVRRKQERKSIEDRLRAKKDESAAEDKAIDACITERTEALKKAKMPVEGLSIDVSGILFNGQPFSQISSGEQLRVAVGMAMAQKPHLRVLRILDGSLLDDKNMAVIERLAIEHNFQVLVEKVDTSGKVGIVIEDGLVIKENVQLQELSMMPDGSVEVGTADNSSRLPSE